MACRSFVFTLYFLVLLTDAASSLTIHVSTGGKDIETCGKILLPCLTVKYAVMESKKQPDEVIIHGYHAKKTAMYYEFPIKLNRTIKFIGKYGTPVIIANNDSLFTATSSSNQQTKVTIINISFRQTAYKDPSKVLIYLEGSSLSISNCSFLSVRRPISVYCDKQCKLAIKKSKIVSPVAGIYLAGTGKIFANLTRTDFIGKDFKSKTALVYGATFWSFFAMAFELRISKCKFTNFTEALRLFTTARVCKIAIRNSTFKHNDGYKSWSTISPSVSVHYTSIGKTKPRMSLLFKAHDCLFQNNDGATGSGISFRVGYGRFYAAIINCTFKDNIAYTTGGAVSFLKEGTAKEKFLIRGSHFENNSVKVTRWPKEPSPLTYGSGGALSFGSLLAYNDLQYDLVYVLSSAFIANSADVVGGTIYSYLVDIALKNTRIITNTNDPFGMVDGTVLSIIGRVLLNTVRIKVNQRKSHISVLRLKGSYYFDKETSLVCPVGTTIGGIMFNLRNSFDFLSLSCNPCDIDKYNLHGSTFSNSTIDYDRCWKCPPGAICQYGKLKPLDNYWGYIDRKHGNLSFIQLPVGYGCRKRQCKRYDSCADNRQGTLCSTCRRGYSESMFSSKCVKNEYCHRRSFWAMAVALIIFYLILFIYKKNLISFLKRQLLWFRKVDRSHKNEFSINEDQYLRFMEQVTTETQTRNPRDDNNTSESQNESSSGLVKIVFYFYQILALLDIYGEKIEHDKVKDIKSVVQNILSFSFLDSSGSSTCAMDDATPVIKVMLRGLYFAAVVTAFILLYVINRVLQSSNVRVCKKLTVFNKKHAFGNKVLAALFEVVLLSYASITKILTSMLDCRTIGDKKVLFLQGNVICYQSWQYGIATTGLAWVVPFCIFINLLPNFIREKHISTKGLFLGCILPIPVIMFYLVKKSTGKNGLENQQQIIGCEYREDEENEVGTEQENCALAGDRIKENENVLISIVQWNLCGPFKDEVNSSKCFSWDGVYIFRRLFIVSVSVFVEDATYKLYVLLAGQILILMHHSHVKPFKSKFLNCLESASLGFLILINGMNLLTVYDSAHGFSEVGNKLLLVKIFAWIETVLHLLVPSLIIASLAVLLAARCLYIILKVLRHCIRAVMRLAIRADS